MQRSRDGSGAHLNDIHATLELLEPFLMLHAEALLLIDNYKAEILELNILRKQPVRTDGDVHPAFGPTDHGTQSDDDNVHEIVQTGVVAAGVFQISEMGLNRCRGMRTSQGYPP